MNRLVVVCCGFNKGSGVMCLRYVVWVVLSFVVVLSILIGVWVDCLKDLQCIVSFGGIIIEIIYCLGEEV